MITASVLSRIISLFNMFNKTEFTTNSWEDTQKFAEEFAKKSVIGQGDSLPIIVTLSGELGAGKTTFVQGFAKGLGIANRIISPTFIIMRTYQIKNRNEKLKMFYHIDLYRIHNEGDLESIGLKEILHERDAVVVIEWPEKLGTLMPEKRWEIKIQSLGENERNITIRNC